MVIEITKAIWNKIYMQDKNSDGQNSNYKTDFRFVIGAKKYGGINLACEISALPINTE